MDIKDMRKEVDDLTYGQVRFFKMALMHTAKQISGKDIPNGLVLVYAAACVKDALGTPSFSDKKRIKRIPLLPETMEENGLRDALRRATHGDATRIASLFRQYQTL